MKGKQEEFEEKLRQAAKEEELKKKAVEAAEKKFKNATAEQKAHYEQELHKLRRELADATQQKLTIAQQTKKGQLTLDTLRFSVPDAPETDADDDEA
jgi:hypothetical protein